MGADVVVCVQAGEDGFLGDCAMLNLTARVVCRDIVEASVGCEDAPVCNFAETCGGAWLGRWVLDWEDGAFVVIEAH